MWAEREYWALKKMEITHAPEPGYRATARIVVKGVALFGDPSLRIRDLINDFYRNIDRYRYITEVDAYYPDLYDWVVKAKPYVEHEKTDWGQLGYFEASYIQYELESPIPAFLAAVIAGIVSAVAVGAIIWQVWIKPLYEAVTYTQQATFKNIENVDKLVDVLYANKLITEDQYSKLKADIGEAKKSAEKAEEKLNEINTKGLIPGPPAEFTNLIMLLLIVMIIIAIIEAIRK